MGFLLGLLFALTLVQKSGSTAFAEPSPAYSYVEEVTKAEGDADPSQDSSLDETAEDVSVSDGDSDIESESSAESGDLS